MDDFRKTININELKKWRRAGKRLAITIGILFIVIVLGWLHSNGLQIIFGWKH